MFTRYPGDTTVPRGGVETVALALVEALTRVQEIDLHVVTLERDVRTIDVSRNGGVTIHRLPGNRWPQMLDILCGPGHRAVKRYLESLSPDIVHFHETHGLTIGSMSVPVVFTVHGFDHANVVAEKESWRRLRSCLWRLVEAHGLAKHRHIISITPYVRRQIEPLTAARITDIDNPVDRSWFDLPGNPKKGRILFAGWISPRKNPLTLVRAVGRLADDELPIELRLAGSAKEKDRRYHDALCGEIRNLGIEDRVSLLGQVTPARLREELAQAAVFVLPSLQENAPMAISESLAVGVPVISSDRCGMPYMIEDGKTGYLVDPLDVDGLADRLRSLLSNPKLRESMGVAAGETARQRFHPDAVARKTVALYREILHGRA